MYYVVGYVVLFCCLFQVQLCYLIFMDLRFLGITSTYSWGFYPILNELVSLFDQCQESST